MKNIFIINAHQPYEFSEGRLNASLVAQATEFFTKRDCSVKTTIVAEGYDVKTELDKHRWADLVIVQMPVNWMGVPWPFKRYMDEVYTAGMNGELCDGDGRSRTDTGKHYGSGGTLPDTRYMLSLTFNAPIEAFDNPDQYLFQGKSVDDLFLPMHMNFRFFAMQALPTFTCYDVLKNPDIDSDFARFEQHLEHIIELSVAD
ncbi:NAD(P)H-dependent oxidoreductase [bacterium SCSIO 12696]|nr:NAD(P)H-dependent oxidoreductase [bacterium SCSIO 12696]